MRLILIGFLFAAFLFLPTTDCARIKVPPHIVTLSPDKTYRVTLEDHSDTSGDTGLNRNPHHEESFTVEKNGKTTINREVLYTGGTYDSTFLELFPQQTWVTDSVMRLGQSPAPSIGDNVTVRNQTNHLLSYLLVRVGKYQMFLILDLAPGSEVSLLAEPQSDQTSDSSFLSGRCRFDNNTIIPETGTNFRIRGKYHLPAHYAVDVKEESIVVSSKEFDPTD